MADYTITVADEHLPRIAAAINGLYPDWRTEHPSFYMSDMAIHLMKSKYLVRLVKQWEQTEIQEVASTAIGNLTEID